MRTPPEATVGEALLVADQALTWSVHQAAQLDRLEDPSTDERVLANQHYADAERLGKAVIAIAGDAVGRPWVDYVWLRGRRAVAL